MTYVFIPISQNAVVILTVLLLRSIVCILKQKSISYNSSKKAPHLLFSRLSIHEYLEKLASNAPVPGGGGTSALVAALGAALGVMVGEIVLPKKKSVSESRQIKAIVSALKKCVRNFEHVIDEDPKVYEAVMATYRKTRKLRNRTQAKNLVDRALECSFRMQQTLAFRIGIASGEIKKLMRLAKGSIANDLLVALALLKGAWQGAYYTAKINVVYINDAGKKRKLMQELKKTPK